MNCPMLARGAKVRLAAASLRAYLVAFLAADDTGVGATVSSGEWARFAKWSDGSAAALVTGLVAAITLLNPFGNFPLGGQVTQFAHRNQRYIYPAIVRSHEFDSAVFGSSTSRLLEPGLLDARLGGRFANLSMDAGTAWEQYRLMKLFLAHTPQPKTLVISLDPFAWCNQRADEQRITFRLFPESFYDQNRLNDYSDILNLEISDVLISTVGMMIGAREPKFDRTGYGDFTPGEANYDPSRASVGVHGVGVAPGPPGPAIELSARRKAAMTFPALDWLKDIADMVPDDTRVVFVRMPVHVADQAVPGSLGAATSDECFRRIVELAQRRGVHVLDMQFASPITTVDLNYWDRRHFRLPIGRRAIDEMAKALSDGASSDVLRVVNRPG